MIQDGLGTIVVYHLTPEENVWSINVSGINPGKALGKMRASWFVSKNHIEWAAIHASVRHHVTPDGLSVCACLIETSLLYKFFKPGFYYCYNTVQPESITPLMFVLHNMGTSDYQ